MNKVLSDERLGAELRVTENRFVLFNYLTYVYKVYIYIYKVYMYTYIHTYITHTHTHTHIYIHIYTHTYISAVIVHEVKMHVSSTCRRVSV